MRIKSSLLSVLALGTTVLAQIDIRLVANWENPPFELRLLETVASENETYYIQALSKIASFSIEDDDEEDEDFEASVERTDEELYHSVFDLLTPIEQSLYDIPLANKYYSPRIISHFKFYNESVIPKFEAKLKSKCGSIPRTWLQYNDVIYCNADDVYALMTEEQTLSDEKILLPFDRVIGTSGPLLILYGDVKDQVFKQFISNLYQSSTDGKFRFVWRYVSHQTEEKEVLNGYGVDLTLKRTDYIVIDDRDVNKGGQKVLREESFNTDNGKNAFLNKYYEEIEPVQQSELADLDVKLSSFALSSDNDTKNYENLKKVINGLPKFSKSLVNQEIDEDLVEQVNYNTKVGLTPDTSAIFINGAPVDENDQNVFGIYNKIKSELKHIEILKSLGFDSFNAKDLLGKFSLYSMFANKGSTSSRHLIETEESPVIFFNDIETDNEYSRLPNDLNVYINRFQFGEVPPLRQNVHSTVLFFRPSEKESLLTLNNLFTSVVQHGIPQRIGFVPLIENEQDSLIANNIYHIVETKGVKKAFKYIHKLATETHTPKTLTDRDYVSEIVVPFLINFDVQKPTIVVNGHFFPLDSDWPYSITRQITTDVQYLTALIYNGKVKYPEDLAEAFYAGSKTRRHSLISPEDPALYKYKLITPEFLKSLSFHTNEVIEFKKENKETFSDYYTLTLGGSLGSKFTLEQLLEISKYALKSTHNIRVRVIDQSDGISFIGRLKQSYNESIEKAIEVIEQILSDHEFVPFEESEAIVNLLSTINIHDKNFLLLNGRYIKLDRILDESGVEFFISHELETRLSLTEALLQKRTFVPTIHQFHDWYEVFSSIITKTYYVEYNGLTKSTSSSRFDFSNAKTEKSIKFGDKDTSDIHFLLAIDPAQEISQRLLSLVDAVKRLPFASIEILLQPRQGLEELQVKRFYLANIQSNVEFNDDGSIKELEYIKFENVPEKTIFSLDVDVHSRWIVVPKESRSDLDNVLLEQSGPVVGTYELENIIIEGNAFTDKTLEAPTGLSVQVQGSDTNVMTILGYIQLKANPGLWDFSIKEGRSSEIYSLLSVDSLKNEDPTVSDSIQLALHDLDGLNIFPRFTKKPGKENETLIISDHEDIEPEEPEAPSKKGFFSKLLSKKETKKPQADINIFTIASGHLYERLASIMTASVMANTKHTVKFWLIDNYMSPTFREFLPHLAEKYGFEYELITYKWPSWLTGQREKQRTIWGYKILFLDVLFPQDLDNVIFVDADQIVRTDLKELVDLDLEGAPYGYTPMGESREEMEGFRFWKQGYWKNYLADKFKYHISALYVIDLKRFREIAAGDRLRHHYSLLSKDPNSLSNLDQDLPNNLQHQLKIFSLPQDWLWCETWCDDESLKTAKTIDLCNNPLTKEHKLDRARRQIPEWNVYDQEIQELHDSVFESKAVLENVIDEIIEKEEIEEQIIDHDEL